ncbi:MAG TPA: hypothetical protein V6C71_01245 [Coleofasciculaceae cyanobacterium]|jgi:ubiquitin-associated SH3 domain-containing protein
MKDEINHCQYIIYACPVKDLNTQLETYFAQSLKLFGENTAHKYMPHCTLTGFFNAPLSLVALYLQALDRAYIEAKNNLALDINIKQLTFKENWHGLELRADGVKQLISHFARLENSLTRPEKLRLKDWLHLSLAYGFSSKDSDNLRKLATETINLKADVNWQLRFYQKNADWSWKCLKTWDLD